MLSVRKLVFAGALLAVVPFAAVGQEKVIPKAEPKAMPPVTTPGTVVTPVPGTVVAPPGAPCPPAPCPQPVTRKVCKMVPTQVQETRTVMKQVQKQECYTAYREETVQEKKCVPVTTYKKITETVMENRTRCIKIPVMEEKVVMEKRKKIEWVTECKTKTKVSFHKECKQIGGKGHLSHFSGKLGGCFGDKCGGGGCGDSCGGGCGGISVPVWKPTCETYTTTVRVPKCTYECVPVCKKVCTYRTETKTECVPVCKTRCVPCTENKEVVTCKKVCVPYQATRCVTECVPVCETVTVCKMVPTWVEEVCPAPAPCAPCCDTGCDSGKGGCFSKFKGCGLFDKFGGCGCGFFDKFKCGFGGGCCK